MLSKEKADKLAALAARQLEQGLEAKRERFETVRDYFDLYSTGSMKLDGNGEETVFNAPFPFFADFVDTLQSKIDNPPKCDFRIPNLKALSDKVQAAWEQEKSSTHAGWNRKDRVEKRQAILSGRAVCKVYASSVDNRYESHYDTVDVFSFVADPSRGHLMGGNYHGETDIFKTHESLEAGAENGWYDRGQVELLKNRKDDENESDRDNRYDRLKAQGISLEDTSFVGQAGVLMTEWVMRDGNEWYYLLFDPKSKIWVRAEKLVDAFKSGKTPFVSWATHHDEWNFWSKCVADDIAPVTESMRFLLNNAIENERRRVRPQRIVDSGALVDVNELQDYMPDQVILRNPGKDPNVVTVETPEATGTINLVEYLDTASKSHVGLQGQGVDEKDAKVGVFYGQLNREADRIGIINKEYSESYSWKGYNFFWGLKQHLTAPKQVEMLGKFGTRLQELTSVELSDADDVDDVIVSGGSAQDELDAVQAERRLNALSELTAAYPDKINPSWVIRTTLEGVNFTEDEIEEALDIDGSVNRELMEEADKAIQDIILGRPVRLNNQADVNFMQRIQDYATEELNWVKLGKDGKEIGVDKKKKELYKKLTDYMRAHQPIVVSNMMRKVREQAFKTQMAGLQEQPAGAQQGVNIEAPGEQEQQLSSARPFEEGTATPGGTASASQGISNTLSGRP